MRDWARLHPDSAAVQWHVFKNWWIEAYAAWERDRVTMQGQGYHGMNNAQVQDDNDNSLASLTEAITPGQNFLVGALCTKKGEKRKEKEKFA
jgi:hypothetical protein